MDYPRDKYEQNTAHMQHICLSMPAQNSVKQISIRKIYFYTALCFWPLLGLAGVGWGLMQTWAPPSIVTLRATYSEDASENRNTITTLEDALRQAQSQNLIAKSATEQKIADLLARQNRLEAHQALVTSLAAMALPDKTGADRTARLSADPSDANPLMNDRFNSHKPFETLPDSVTSYMPANHPVPMPESDTPAKAAVTDEQGELDTAPLTSFAQTNPNAPGLAPENSSSLLGMIETHIDQSEKKQFAVLDTLTNVSDRALIRNKQALINAGLQPNQLTLPSDGKAATGGPFVPVKLDQNATPFDKAVLRAKTNITQAIRLRQLMPYIPLRRPLTDDAEITSGFGERVDPFNGQMALHTGVDFRLDYGSAVHPTAAGTVVAADINGGYGKMVDVDHGNGLVTRYGHLSAILVKEGDKVTPSSIIGRLGSTGRSTGPHLHYEVRINDEPVNPMRFIKAGEAIYPIN